MREFRGFCRAGGLDGLPLTSTWKMIHRCTFSDGLQRFRDHLWSSPWEDPFLGSHEVPDSPRTRTVVRCAGLVLTMLGLVHLAGMVS